MKVVVQIEEAQAILAGAVCRSQFPSPAYKLPGIGDGGLQRKASFVVIPQVEVALAQERLCAPVRPFSLCRPALREKAEELFSLAEEHGFTHFRAGATLLRGWTLLAQGGGAEGLSQICQGLEAVRATGTGLTVPGWLIIGAGAHGSLHQAEGGLAVLAEAETVMDRSGEHILAAELYRVKGELTLAQSSGRNPQWEAEECFRKAMEIARCQGTRSLELRAVMSLSRLWQRQGKTAKARAWLAKIYGWFTEGFDTADLKAAKALLEALALPRTAVETVSK